MFVCYLCLENPWSFPLCLAPLTLRVMGEIMLMTSLGLRLYCVLRELLQHRPQYSRPETLVWQHELQQDVVHLAVVWVGEGLVYDVNSSLLFLLGGVVEDQRPPQDRDIDRWEERRICWHQSGAWRYGDTGVSVKLEGVGVLLNVSEFSLKFLLEIILAFLQVNWGAAFLFSNQSSDEVLSESLRHKLKI